MIGSTIQHYRITAKLGQGGMGEVYRATDSRLGRSVALKLMTLPADSSESAETWERLVREAANEKAPSSDSGGRSRAGDARLRFLREARTVSALNHPGIVVIYDVGEWEGRLFIAMELVEGQTLREKLKEGSLDPKAVVKMGITLAEALVRAHQAGVIHRDIKPENIIIANDGQAKLLDFGIAKLRHPTAPAEDAGGATLDHSLTTPGFILGTVHYMSPEQTRQQEVDPRSDLFSLGAVLYECLTGRKAFDGPMVDAMYHIAHNHPAAIRQLVPAVPEDLERIVEKLMEKDRDERYQNSGDLLVDLRRAERRMIAIASGSTSGIIMQPPPPLASQPASPSGITPVAGAGVVPVAGAGVVPVAVAGVTPVASVAERSSASSGTKRRWGVAALFAVAAGAAIAGALIGGVILQSGGAKVQSQLYPVTHLRREINQPALSPDGKLITFIAGDSQVYVALTSSGEATQLTHSSEPKTYPRFSADGSRIVYTQQDPTYDLWEVPALGGEPHRLVSQAAFGAFSPDGSHLAFARLTSTNGNWTMSLYVGDARGDNLRKLADIGSSPNLYPVWTPDSRTIVYMEAYQRRRQPRLLAVPANDKAAPRVLPATGLISMPPAVSQDGKWVYYSAAKENIINLWRIPLEGGKPEQVTFSTGEDHSPSLDPNGWLYYVSARHRSRLHLLSAAGSKLLADETLVAEAAISPDGKSLAFIRPAWSGTVLGELILVDVASQKAQRIDTPELVGELRWSPDSKLLGYGSRATGSFQSFIYDVSAGRSTPVPPTDGEETLLRGFSSKGPYLLEHLRDGQSLGRLVVRDPATGKETPISTTATTFGWSADGKWIGLLSLDATGQAQRVLLAPADGGAAHEVYSGPNASPNFYPDRPELLIATSLAPPQLKLLPILPDGSGGPAKPYVSPVLLRALTEYGAQAIKDVDLGHDLAVVLVNESDMDIVKRKVIP